MATTQSHCSVSSGVLYVAFELGERSYKLAFTVGLGQKPRIRSVPARNTAALLLEIAKAKKRFGLPADAPVRSCYEAGRDGFWLHRWLVAQGIDNVIVDSSSIEVNRRKRRAKTDRLDAAHLVMMLVRWALGERKLWSVLRVPSDQAEDGRQLHRELETLKSDHTEYLNRIGGLLATQGVSLKVDADFVQRLDTLRRWDGTPLPEALRKRLERELQRLQFVEQQMEQLERQRLEHIRSDQTMAGDQVRQLLGLRGIGINSWWLFVRELFGWREPANRRQVGALFGLTPTPYQSGDGAQEQGISKAGVRRLRPMAVEIAWLWLEYQPASALSRWYQQRFGKGNARVRRIGIVALARKLMVALWKYLKWGEVPAGAVLTPWETKLRVRRSWSGTS